MVIIGFGQHVILKVVLLGKIQLPGKDAELWVTDVFPHRIVKLNKQSDELITVIWALAFCALPSQNKAISKLTIRVKNRLCVCVCRASS